MAVNQEKGQKTKSKIKATQKDVWSDEEIDMLLNIFKASSTSGMQIETIALETPNRLARDRYPSVEAIKYRKKAIFFLTSTAFHIT